MDGPLIDRSEPEWAPVQQFFISCLHQDFDAEHESAWAAVRDYASGPGAEQDRAAGRGIRRLLAMFDDDEELADAVDRLGMAYDPPSDGYTYHQWLEEVAAFLESRP